MSKPASGVEGPAIYERNKEMKSKQTIEFNLIQKTQTEKRVSFQRIELKRLNAKYKTALDAIKQIKKLFEGKNQTCSKCEDINKIINEALFNIKGTD